MSTLIDVRVEICINSRDLAGVRGAVNSAYRGGASYVELCSDMHLGGTTPARDHIIEARMGLSYNKGLMVMIRPRGGDFYYTTSEIKVMRKQVLMASEAGADGVVFGVLNESTGKVNIPAVEMLVKTAKDNGLRTGFHRAIDAAHDPVGAVDNLAGCGIDRILTAGIQWGKDGSALDGIPVLKKMITKTDGNIDIVIGGGIGPDNAQDLLENIPLDITQIILHSYSGVMKNGRTDRGYVNKLVSAVLNFKQDIK